MYTMDGIFILLSPGHIEHDSFKFIWIPFNSKAESSNPVGVPCA